MTVGVTTAGVTSACWPVGPEGPLGASGIASMTAETVAAAPAFHLIPRRRHFNRLARLGELEAVLLRRGAHANDRAALVENDERLGRARETILSTVPRTPNAAVGVAMT